MTQSTQSSRVRALSVFIFAALGGVLYGYDLGIIAAALLFIHHDIPMTAQQMSYLVAAVLGGGAVATLVSGRLADYFGRRRMIMMSSIFFLIGVFMVAAAHTYSIMLIGRLVQGIGVGIVTIAVPLYLAESMPASLRGRGVSVFQLLLTSGILLASLVSLYFTPTHDWRGMFISAAVPGVIMFFGCFLLTDSPRWLAMKGKFEKARWVLEKTRTVADAKKELADIKKTIAADSVDGKSKKKISIWQKHFMVPLAIVVGAAVLQQLTGINSILQFSAVILKHAGLHSNIAAVLGSTAITGLNFLVTCLSLFLISIVGRRVLLAVGTGGIVVSLLVAGAVLILVPAGDVKGYALLISILFFIFFYAFGPGTLIWLVLAELLPSRIRGTGMAVALFLNSMMSTVFAAMFLKLVHWFGGYTGVFWLCAGFAFLYFLLVLIFVPETKGKTLEEIEHLFAKPKA
jgi:MFS transporter, SP family, galactose:H+ symporter